MREFLNDLNFADLNDIKWIFERRDGLINRSTLRDKVRQSMINELADINGGQKLLPNKKFDIFQTNGLVDETHIDAFLDANFNSIFINTEYIP